MIYKQLLLVLLVLFSCTKTKPIHLSVKRTNLPFNQVRELLPILQKNNTSLYLKVMEHDLGSHELLQVLRDAEEKDIRIIIWPLLTPEQGPWANEHNYTLFGDLIRKTVDWLIEEGISPEYIVINMENARAQMDSIKYYLKSEQYTPMVRLILSNLDRERFNKAVEEYRQIVRYLHQKGYRVMLTTYPFMIDDFRDNDPDIQDLTNTPILGIDWDAYTFTTYRTSYSGDLGVTFTPYMVYEYGRAADALFHEKARLALGIIGTNHHGPGFASPDDLHKDIAAARAAGIEEVDLFYLGGMIQEGRFEDWINTGVPAQKPPFDIKVATARAFVKTLDKILDNRNRTHHLEKIVAVIENLRKRK